MLHLYFVISELLNLNCTNTNASHCFIRFVYSESILFLFLSQEKKLYLLYNMHSINNHKSQPEYQTQKQITAPSLCYNQSDNLLIQFKIYIVQHLIQQMISRKLKSIFKRVRLNGLQLQELYLELNQTPKNKLKTSKYSKIKLSTPIYSNFAQNTYFEQYRGQSSYYYPNNRYDSKYTTPRHHLKTIQAAGSAREYNLYTGKQNSIKGYKQTNIKYEQFYDTGRFKSNKQTGNHQRIKTSNIESPYGELDIREKIDKGSLSRDSSKRRDKSIKFNEKGCTHKNNKQYTISRKGSVTKLLYLILKRIYYFNLGWAFEQLYTNEIQKEDKEGSEGRQTYFDEMTQENALLKESVQELKDQIFIKKSQLEIKTRQLKQINIRFEYLSKFSIFGQLDWRIRGHLQIIFQKLIFQTKILQGKQENKSKVFTFNVVSDPLQQSQITKQQNLSQFKVIYNSAEYQSPTKLSRDKIHSKSILPFQLATNLTEQPKEVDTPMKSDNK